MKQSYYFFSSGVLSRKDNTLRLTTEDGHTSDIPIERVADIFCFGEISVNSKLLSMLSKYGICLHFFNFFENYIGTYYPRESLISGDLHVKQAAAYIDSDKRLSIAKGFLTSGVYNMTRNLRYYSERGKQTAAVADEIKSLIPGLERANDINELMGAEGNIRRAYYSCWNEIMPAAQFESRVRNPPDNMVNSLISFCNMLVYSTCVSELYATQLNPSIGFLHSPGQRRFSLSLDLAEVFKPLLADRLIFSLVNKRMIDESAFAKDSNSMLLKDDFRKIIVSEYDKILKRTIKHRALGREVSYRRLIRLDAYKLVKTLLGEQSFQGFRIWW